jgi:glutamate formiminotransferase
MNPINSTNPINPINPITMRLLECVPNISEGRDQKKISLIEEALKKVKGVKLLDISSDKDHNRSVFTFIGEPQAAKDAAFSLALKALDLIDMREHHGAHPRLGAVDVVPFVPIQGVEMEEAVQIAREFGKELGRKGVPIFFYEEAATSPERKDLPDSFNPKSGATVVGARFPLVAYNVNLETQDIAVAKEIAKRVRFKDGGFPNVRAIAVDSKEKGMVQVSMNLTNYRVTNIPKVFEFIREEALKRGVEIGGSEIIGLIPLGVLEGIAQSYLKCPEFSVRQVIEQRILEFE